VFLPGGEGSDRPARAVVNVYNTRIRVYNTRIVNVYDTRIRVCKYNTHIRVCNTRILLCSYLAAKVVIVLHALLHSL
jgi:hypothetical protein